MEPERTCLGCRTRAARSSLLRMVVQGDEIVVDRSATLSGRGAWVHLSAECVGTAVKRNAFGRALTRPDATLDREELGAAIYAYEVSNRPSGSAGFQSDQAGRPSENRPVTN